MDVAPNRRVLFFGLRSTIHSPGRWMFLFFSSSNFNAYFFSLSIPPFSLLSALWSICGHMLPILARFVQRYFIENKVYNN